MSKEYILYCDESVEKGTYFSDFYGGVGVWKSDREKVEQQLNQVKQQQNLLKEIKWTKVTAPYLSKYEAVMDAFFDLIEGGFLKVRIMFRQNATVPTNLSQEQKHNGYFLLYYQFIKHVFGFAHADFREPVFIHPYFDELPDSKAKCELFKNHIYAIQSLPMFKGKNVYIRRRDIAEIDSKDHVLLQCLDIVLGAIAFRLNDLHKAKPPGQWKRGKRTIAKEKLYKHILKRIRRIHPNFNIGINTGGTSQERWLHLYRHWKFVPRDMTIDTSKYKQKN